MKLGIWASIQDSVFMQREMLSQAEHIFAFSLKMKQDREKVGAVLDIKLPQKYPDPHGFFYGGTEETRYFPDIQTATGLELIG